MQSEIKVAKPAPPGERRVRRLQGQVQVQIEVRRDRVLPQQLTALRLAGDSLREVMASAVGIESDTHSVENWAWRTHRCTPTMIGEIDTPESARGQMS